MILLLLLVLLVHHVRWSKAFFGQSILAGAFGINIGSERLWIVSLWWEGRGCGRGKKEAGKYGDYLLVGKRVKGEKR